MRLSLLYSTSSLWCKINRALLTIDSFIPILLISSISRLSDMWLPIPILLFIWVSACCHGEPKRVLLKSKNKQIKKRKCKSGRPQHAFISFAISAVRFICWFIPDFAASIVETLKSLMASKTFSSVATWDLNEIEVKKMKWVNCRRPVFENFWIGNADSKLVRFCAHGSDLPSSWHQA